MSSLARYASGASVIIPLANTDTTTARTAGRSANLFFSNWIRNNVHLFIQVMLFALIISMLSIHITNQQSASKLSAFEAAPIGAEDHAFDELSSTEVAAVVALTTETIVSDEVVAMAEQVDAGESVAATSEDFLSKPAVALTDDDSSAGIASYVVTETDTLASIAAHFGVSEDTVLWSNGFKKASDLKPGATLSIPPVSGVVYTVGAGDTAEKIAAQFNADVNSLVTFNDAEISGLQAGQKIVVPGGVVTAPVAPAPAARSRVYAAAAQVDSAVPATGSSNNGYSYGYCTWGVANLVGVPRGWGNANRWAASARASGFRVDNTPAVGAIAQTSAGWGGHVGLVIGVEGDKIIMKDMNGPAGFGRYGVGTYSASNYNYIHL